mmetsp:Transcript_53694/g.125160  ORF Transcript_53694/g.125160 Transcript_53694/m.125160 type:complete len:237 (-) Transcript_53694:1282-1992(-)
MLPSNSVGLASCWRETRKRHSTAASREPTQSEHVPRSEDVAHPDLSPDGAGVALDVLHDQKCLLLLRWCHLRGVLQQLLLVGGAPAFQGAFAGVLLFVLACLGLGLWLSLRASLALDQAGDVSIFCFLLSIIHSHVFLHWLWLLRCTCPTFSPPSGRVLVHLLLPLGRAQLLLHGQVLHILKEPRAHSDLDLAISILQLQGLAEGGCLVGEELARQPVGMQCLRTVLRGALHQHLH